MSLTIASVDWLKLFEVDGLVSAGVKAAAEAPTHPTEAGAVISDFSVLKADTYRATGKLSYNPPPGQQAGAGRVAGAVDALRALMAARQPVFWVAPHDSRLVLLTEIGSDIAASDGYAATVEVTAQQWRTVKPTTTTMPASRVRPAQQPGAAAPKPGAGTKTKPPTSIVSKLRRG